ncbi:hypothetical protein Drorol1_Dr00026204 [Drosera rotundifolia]
MAWPDLNGDREVGVWFRRSVFRLGAACLVWWLGFDEGCVVVGISAAVSSFVGAGGCEATGGKLIATNLVAASVLRRTACGEGGEVELDGGLTTHGNGGEVGLGGVPTMHGDDDRLAAGSAMSMVPCALKLRGRKEASARDGVASQAAHDECVTKRWTKSPVVGCLGGGVRGLVRWCPVLWRVWFVRADGAVSKGQTAWPDLNGDREVGVWFRRGVFRRGAACLVWWLGFDEGCVVVGISAAVSGFVGAGGCEATGGRLIVRLLSRWFWFGTTVCAGWLFWSVR